MSERARMIKSWRVKEIKTSTDEKMKLGKLET
jgi:hypothetical protein